MGLIDKRFSSTGINEKSTPLPIFPKEILRTIYALLRTAEGIYLQKCPISCAVGGIFLPKWQILCAGEGIFLSKWQILCANEGIFLTKCPHLHFVKTYIYKKLNLLTFKITGSYQLDWDGSNYTSGVYFYTLQTGDYKETKKMLLVK